MKKALVLVVALLLCGSLVGFGVHYVSSQFLSAEATNTNRDCSKKGASHVVTIQNGSLDTATLQAKRCDTLTITNKDDIAREMAFGEHDHHTAYNGVVERVLGKDQSLTVTLDRSGTFLFHDHLHDEVKGQFVVSN